MQKKVVNAEIIHAAQQRQCAGNNMTHFNQTIDFNKNIQLRSQHHFGHQLRRAFTLFEVSISLAIVAFGVVSVMLLIPTGIKVQQHARLSILATAKAVELIQDFSSNVGGERQAEIEAVEPWDARPFCYSSSRWDLEYRTSRWDGGIIPLPLEIAKRLDSEGDEIQKLISEGAYIYYADPKVLPGVDPRYTNSEAPNEAKKLIFAVSGYAQNNAITRFPWKAWPYRMNYPSSPMMIDLDYRYQMAPLPIDPAGQAPASSKRPWSGQYPGSSWNSVEGWANGLADPARPQDRDPLLQEIANASATYFFKLRGTKRSTKERLEFEEDTADANSLIPLRRKLVEAVVAFCKDKFDFVIGAGGEYTQFYNLPPGDATYYRGRVKDFRAHFATLCRNAEVIPGQPYDAARAKMRAQIALRVQCMRFLAFAAQTFYLKHLGETEPDFEQAFANGKDVTIDGTPLTVDRLRYYHDCSKEAAMLYAASFPYDWGAPRPVTRCIGQDESLFEFDLFNARNLPMAGVGGTKATMWKPISAQTITSIGLPGMFPGVLTYSATSVTGWNMDESPFRTNAYPRDHRGNDHPFWGDASHFTLTRPFLAAERCRELVFWAVDWQSYEDFETAAGAPMDASRYGRKGMSANDINGDRTYIPRASYDSLHLRNPERVLQFNKSMLGEETGKIVRNNLVGIADGDGNINVLTGQFGADRNHNYILDRGPLPKSVRLRAHTIARFQFYDPRLSVLHR